MSYKNKWVWITGASEGLGEGLAYAFAKQNANIILSARNKQKLEVVKSNCKTSGIVKVLVVDLEKLDTLTQICKNLLKDVGRIDVMVHNGGISQRSLVSETDFSVDKRIMNINFLSYVAITKAILPQMIANRSGHFVVTSSLVGKFSTPLRSTYAASKHALHGFFDALRAENKQNNIKVTIICPGFIHTNVSVNALTENGNPTGKMDEAQKNGMSVEEFSLKAMRAISTGKNEVVIGGRERFGVLLNRLFPTLFSRMISKVKVT